MQTDCKRDDNVRGPSVQDFGLDDHGFSHYQEFGFTFLTTHMYVYCKYDLNMYFKYIYIIHIICFQCDSNAHIYTCVFSACFPVIQGRSHDYRSCFFNERFKDATGAYQLAHQRGEDPIRRRSIEVHFDLHSSNDQKTSEWLIHELFCHKEHISYFSLVNYEPDLSMLH